MGHRIFIAVLLLCLGFAVVRFNAIRHRTCLNYPSSPSLASLPAGELSELRAKLAGVMSRADGRVYSSGSVPVDAVWSDDPPAGSSLELSSGHGPASDEIREWVPDPIWGSAYRDDIAGDVFVFANVEEARRFFDQAASPRCHRSGAVRPISRLPAARGLTWFNPDDANEQDIYVLRGPLVYRLVDVRPGSKERPRSEAPEAVAVSTLTRLACTLPQADCPSPGAAQRFVEDANAAVCALNGELVSEAHEATPFVLFPIRPRTRGIVANSVQRLSAITPPPGQASAYRAMTAALVQLLAIGARANAARAARDTGLVNRYYYDQAPRYQREFVNLADTLGLIECTPVKPA